MSFRVRADEIRRLMTRYGEVRDVYIPEDYNTRRPRGFAFVEFFDPRDAREAMYRLDRHVMDGREITIVVAKDKRKAPDEMRAIGGGGRRDNSRERGSGDREGRDRPRANSDDHDRIVKD